MTPLVVVEFQGRNQRRNQDTHHLPTEARNQDTHHLPYPSGLGTKCTKPGRINVENHIDDRSLLNNTTLDRLELAITP
jgi:hypothetical protein